MHKALALWVTTFMAIGLHAEAAEPVCAAPPKPVADYLIDHPQWHLIDPEDLVKDQAVSWRQYDPYQCPGLVVFDADGSRRASFALGLVDLQGTSRQVIVLLATPKIYEIHTILPPSTGGNASTLILAPPGDYHEIEATDKTGRPRTVHLKTEGFQIIYPESSAILIYFEKGRFKELWNSD